MEFMPVPTCNDGSEKAPYLRTDINLMTLSGLAEGSSGPRFDWLFGMPLEGYQQLASDGFIGVQSHIGHSPSFDKLDVYGMGVTAAGLADSGNIAQKIANWKRAGYECASVIYGTGRESAEEASVKVKALLAASEKYHLPVYIELHRSSITEDIERTLSLIETFPQVRFNADFSHYIVSYRMIETADQTFLDRLNPILKRVCMVHGRLADSHSAQLSTFESDSAINMYRYLLLKTFRLFHERSEAGDFLIFAPELLPKITGYAQYKYQMSGIVEIGDRYTLAKELKQLASNLFVESGDNTPIEYPTVPRCQNLLVADLETLHAKLDSIIDDSSVTLVDLGTPFMSASDRHALVQAFIDFVTDNQKFKNKLLVETRRNTLLHSQHTTLDLMNRFPDLQIALNAGEWVVGEELTLDKLSGLLKNIKAMKQSIRAVIVEEMTAENRLKETSKVKIWCKWKPVYIIDSTYKRFYKKIYTMFAGLEFIER